MSDSSGHAVTPQSEPAATTQARATAPSRGVDHGVQTIEELPFSTAWLHRPILRRGLRYAMTWGISALLLGFLIFRMGMSPFVALLVSGLVYAGFFVLLIWRPTIEIERETIAEDIRNSLARSHQIHNDIRHLVPELELRWPGSDGKLSLERIDGLVERTLHELERNPGTTLSTADRLEGRLSDFFIMLDLFRRTSDTGAEPPPPCGPLGRQLVEEILPLMERWLTSLSTSLGAEDALNFDIAVRVMRDTLGEEGLPRIK